MLEIKRLHLARLEVAGEQWPVHGFVVTHPGGAMLVDTGVGGPEEVLSDWRVGDPSVARPPAERPMTPRDTHPGRNPHPPLPPSPPTPRLPPPPPPLPPPPP